MIVNGIAFKDLTIFLSSRDEISSVMSSIVDPQSARSKFFTLVYYDLIPVIFDRFLWEDLAKVDADIGLDL